MKLTEWLKHIAESFAVNGFTDEFEKEIINNINSFEYKIHDWLLHGNIPGLELAIGFTTESGKVYIWFDRDGTLDLEEQIKKLVGQRKK